LKKQKKGSSITRKKQKKKNTKKKKTKKKKTKQHQKKTKKKKKVAPNRWNERSCGGDAKTFRVAGNTIWRRRVRKVVENPFLGARGVKAS